MCWPQKKNMLASLGRDWAVLQPMLRWLVYLEGIWDSGTRHTAAGFESSAGFPFGHRRPRRCAALNPRRLTPDLGDAHAATISNPCVPPASPTTTALAS